jgi:hypothetical protein
MEHDWKLECTIDEFVDMVIEDNPQVKHLASIIGKCERRFFKYENNCFSEDEYSAMLPVLESEIHNIIREYQYSHKLTTLMNPHLRAIWKRPAKWLAAKLNITEAYAQQLKNTAWSKVWSMLSAAEEYLLARFGREIPSWSSANKDIKKYFKEDK